MLIMLVIDILVCPGILLVHYDAASMRPPKLPGTGNTFSRSFFSKKIVRPL